MGRALDEEFSRSKGDKEIATARARQAHYIKWTPVKKIPDPCGPEDGYQRIVAIYGEYVKNGANSTIYVYRHRQALPYYCVLKNCHYNLY